MPVDALALPRSLALSTQRRHLGLALSYAASRLHTLVVVVAAAAAGRKISTS